MVQISPRFVFSSITLKLLDMRKIFGKNFEIFGFQGPLENATDFEIWPPKFSKKRIF